MNQIIDLDPEEPLRVRIHTASLEAIRTVRDGERSPYHWLRLPNGDLMLGVFPQGDTYEAVQADARYPGPEPDILWCESCGERPMLVRTKHAGLCVVCAARTIDDERPDT